MINKKFPYTEEEKIQTALYYNKLAIQYFSNFVNINKKIRY